MASPDDVVDYSPGRFWTYPKGQWTPRFPFNWGCPMFGQTDEWGRRTVVWGFWFTGYLVWAYATCWCEDCHHSRQETYVQKHDYETRLW